MYVICYEDCGEWYWQGNGCWTQDISCAKVFSSEYDAESEANGQAYRSASGSVYIKGTY